ncbi:MAG: preprotein translocase subunit SecA [Chloroflexota bacterium]
MLSWIKRVVGTANDRELKRIEPLIAEINTLEDEYKELSDAELRDKTTELRGCVLAGDELDAILPEAFAAVREAGRRTLGMRHYDVQLIGGIALHEGKIAEMRTGEGKTLVATLPLYLNALAGRGVHLVTVNDYLAKRDAQWMGSIYHALGMSVGVIQHDVAFIYDPDYPADDPSLRYLRPCSHRREAYRADITYGTNNEFGFDYLRDNMVWDLNDMVQRELSFAIVDEVDNILIDEARTPLIISGPAEESADDYRKFAAIVPRLHEGEDKDFTIEQRHRSIQMTEQGIARVEQLIGVENLYDSANYQLTHYLENALKAQFVYQRDDQYVVKDGEIVIVDEFTGRLMPGRRYSEGLHQAIEAKEGVRVQRENVTLARITFQNYFRLYEKLGGMTGTAATEVEEFRRIYNLDVVAIPTHRPMVRDDASDLVYKSVEAKYQAVVDEIEERHKLGQPVLVGSTSIEKSELISQLLVRRGIRHEVLNAKQHEREAHIISQAGRSDAVTIATNMAGRGVDILLGGNAEGVADDLLRKQGVDRISASPEQLEEATRQAKELCESDRQKVSALGGLHIVGTDRHEARRIDNQLRGRAGRQGDPGSSRFYIALDDDLMRRFGGERIAGMMGKLGLEEDVPLEHSWVNKSIENAQSKVEAYNYDIRKHVVEYDDVLNKQREVIYADRRRVLEEDAHRPMLMEWLQEELVDLIASHTAAERVEDWDLEGLIREVATIFPLPSEITLGSEGRLTTDDLLNAFLELANGAYDRREEEFTPEVVRMLERAWMLNVIDRHWIQHLTAIDDLREGIGFRAYGQRDPLVEYKVESASMFDELLGTIRHDVLYALFHVVPRAQQEEPPRRPPPMTTNREEESRLPVRAGRRVGRNDPCPCGSGQKYKRCHGK